MLPAHSAQVSGHWPTFEDLSALGARFGDDALFGTWLGIDGPQPACEMPGDPFNSFARWGRLGDLVPFLPAAYCASSASRE